MNIPGNEKKMRLISHPESRIFDDDAFTYMSAVLHSQWQN